jgi:methylphosphotriester-DNA--protein-cysteine methyltransferase
MVNASGKKYHQKGCKMIKKDAKELTISEAVKKGYTPCKICHPEKKEKKK